MNRDDFLLLNTGVIYFDNAATTLKPKCVVDSLNDYYVKYSSNIHRGMYDIAKTVDLLYERVRFVVKEFVHCSSAKEVIFTSGTTASINLLVFGFMKYYLKPGDEVLLSKAEHASNILPWLVLAKEIGFIIKYVPLNKEYKLDYESFLNSVSSNTKVVSLAAVTNVVGDKRDISRIGKYCRSHNILFHVDGAQSVPHEVINFNLDCIDFLSFSGHKMCGPTGVGCFIIREDLISMLQPVFYGGGMNADFSSDSNLVLADPPNCYEAGTPPIAEVLGLGAAIDYLNDIGLDVISKYEEMLKKYLLEKLSRLSFVKIFNHSTDSGIVSFKVNGISSNDVSKCLNDFHICVRAGNHCSKLLKEDSLSSTVRVSLYFYNTILEIDYFISILEILPNIFKVVES